MRWGLAALLALAGCGGAMALAAGSMSRSFPPALAQPAAKSTSAKLEPVAEADSKGRVFLTEADARRAAEKGLLPVGVRSILHVPRQLSYGDFSWDDEGVPAGELAIWVDVDRQMISVFRAGHEIGTAVALYGMDGKETPLGRFPIKAKRADYVSRTYDAPMPYSLWLTDDGVAVHASPVREGRATNGCVGVPLNFARQLFETAEIGDVVEVVSSRRQG